jgi:carbon starvation protein
VFLVPPDLKAPAISRFIDGSGLVFAGKLFPFCFITIACGAISGFHTLISSGITPKIITRESYARPIGYGAMCLESLVAIMALIAACTLDPGVYLGMNVKGDPAATVKKISDLGFPVTVEKMDDLAQTMGEKSLFGRTGGAATLAVGMAQIFSGVTRRLTQGHWMDLWYHFAIMFEALFILTTLDAGTRVGRYLLHDVLGNLWKPLGETKSLSANVLASVLVVAGWGYFLIQGVLDPLGGINSLWPLFGIANQLLASIALCLATTVILKMQLQPASAAAGAISGRLKPGRPVLALVTLLPLAWLLTVTFTAGTQKIFSPLPQLGFLAKASSLDQALPALESKRNAARAAGDTAGADAVTREIRTNRAVCFNNRLDAGVAGVFLVLVVGIVGLAALEWALLLSRRRPAVLREQPPVWLPEYATRESRAAGAMGMLAIMIGLARELTDEAALERAARLPACACGAGKVNLLNEDRAVSPGRQYEEVVAQRRHGVNRCC